MSKLGVGSSSGVHYNQPVNSSQCHFDELVIEELNIDLTSGKPGQTSAASDILLEIGTFNETTYPSDRWHCICGSAVSRNSTGWTDDSAITGWAKHAIDEVLITRWMFHPQEGRGPPENQAR